MTNEDDSEQLRFMEDFDIRSYDAVGDGATNDTTPLQSAIDACAARGGGTVVVPAGRYVTGTIVLRSHVHLRFEPGASLLASLDLAHFPSFPSRLPSYNGEMETHKALLLADEAEDISVTGPGTIDGRCLELDIPYKLPSFANRPRLIHFRGCRKVRVRDITLRDAATWVQHYLLCEDLVIDGITVNSRENKDIAAVRYATCKGLNQDGLDIDSCREVRVGNCSINSGDDAIVLKSRPGLPCQDVVVVNCTVSSNASGLKLGTESNGDFRRVCISNCTVRDTRCDGISVIMVDGAACEQISFQGILMDNIKGSAIFIRLGNRGRPIRRDDPRPSMGSMRDISVSDVLATRIGGWCGNNDTTIRNGASVTGLPEHRVDNVSLTNISIRGIGGASSESVGREIPELAENYPTGRMFGELPAYGLYCRHIDGLWLRDCRFFTDIPDPRPVLVMEDVLNAEIHEPLLEHARRTR